MTEITKLSNESWAQWLFRTDGRAFWGVIKWYDEASKEYVLSLLSWLDYKPNNTLTKFLKLLLDGLIEKEKTVQFLLQKAPNKQDNKDLFDNYFLLLMAAQRKYEKTGDRLDLERIHGGKEGLYTIEWRKEGKCYVWTVELSEGEKKFIKELNKPWTKKKKELWNKIHEELTIKTIEDLLTKIKEDEEKRWWEKLRENSPITLETTRNKNERMLIQV